MEHQPWLANWPFLHFGTEQEGRTKNTLNIDEIRVDDAFDLYALCNCLVELLNKF